MIRRLFIIFFILEILIFLAISSLPISNPTLYNTFKNQQATVANLSLISMIFYIFPHNLEVASIEFIPVFGQFFFLISAYETSLIIAVEGSALNLPGFVIFLSLALLPDTWIELPSYALACSTSVYFIYMLIRKRGQLMAKSSKILLMYLFIVIELAIAGSFESYSIVLERVNVNAYAPLLLWIPAIPVIIGLVFLFRKINRDEYVMPQMEQNSEESFS